MLYEDKAKVLSDVKGISLKNEISPLDIINKGLMKGIDAVSLLYTKGVYFLPDLMLAGDAMMESVKNVKSSWTQKVKQKELLFVLLLKRDPHDIGKNLILMFLRAGGYEAIDLGRDVPTEKVVEAVKYHPLFMTGTALMTTTMTAFKKL